MSRRGTSILEAMVAGVLLAAAVGVCAHFVGVTAAHRRTTQQRMIAMQEAANIMERLSAQPWRQLTAGEASDVRISPQAMQSLPQGKLEVEISGPAGTPEAKRIRVSIRWQNRTGQFLQPVQLIAWRYRSP
jgi:Tfp pilus assembly protein PilV